MKKIISLFQRNYDGDRLVRDAVVADAEWVLAGEGVATEKLDGTSCLFKEGLLWKRYDAKRGKEPPPGFIAAQPPDAISGHWPGWIRVGDGPEDRWHREAWDRFRNRLSDGRTYELVGPKIQANPYGMRQHELWQHGGKEFVLDDVPRSFDQLKTYFQYRPIEGVVWHHDDGRMVKIKRKDFGWPWPEDDDFLIPEEP